MIRRRVRRQRGEPESPDQATVHDQPESFERYTPAEPHQAGQAPASPVAGGRSKVGPGRSRRPGALPPGLYFGAAGVVVVVAALAVAALAVLTRKEHHGTAPTLQVPAAGLVPSIYSSARSASVFGPINSRAQDPQPLTAEEVFKPRSIGDRDSKADLKLTDSKIDTQCASAVWGARLARELQQGGCTQATRGLYGDKKFTVMVTIFNLAHSNSADRLVATIAPRSGAGFAIPLDGERFGRSFSTARGVAMGHYAVITWVQRADGTGDAQDKDLLSLLVTTGRPEAVLTRAIRKG